MPWIDWRKPNVRCVKGTGRVELAANLALELEKQPGLEVHIVQDGVSMTAFLIDRGSINYRPED